MGELLKKVSASRTVISRICATEIAPRVTLTRSARGSRSIATPSIAIEAQDYQQFEQLLMGIQDAWTKRDLPAMQRMATPEMIAAGVRSLAPLWYMHTEGEMAEIATAVFSAMIALAPSAAEPSRSRVRVAGAGLAAGAVLAGA